MGHRVGTKSFLTLSAMFFAVFFVFTSVNAAPHDGDEFMLSQPDGSLVPVLVWGDEFYQDVETPDGFTLIRDADGWIYYAKLSADGNEYVSTGVRYTGIQSRSTPNVPKKLRISRESIREKHRRNREAVGYDNDAMIPEDRSRVINSANAAADGFSHAPMEIRMMMGLTVLINFPSGTHPETGAPVNATTAAVTREAMEEFCNREGGFRGTNAAGSVRDWFLDVSNGTLDYSNIVAEHVTVTHPKEYYDRGTNYQYVPELLQSALNVIKTRAESGQLDLSGLSTEGSNNTVMALNVLYAGSPSQGWSNGIWPHQGTYRAPSGQSVVTINLGGGRTIRFGRYQLASLGSGSNPPGIGTFVHENGHMIMRWPDLYNYDNTVTNVVSQYCVMSSSNGSNPQMPNPRFRAMAGWTALVDITNFTDTVLYHPANDNLFAYQFRRNNRESYIIEARRRVGRSANIPGEGLIIWHIDTSGVNTRLNTSRPFPLVKVVRADVAASTATAFPSGSPGANAPFRAGGGSRNTTFNGTSSPAALYHDGVRSPIRVSEVSALGDVMSFRIGSPEGGPVTYHLMVEGGAGGGYYAAGTNVTISAPEVNAAGRGFYRWTSSNTTAVPANVNACTTTITMPAAELSVTANFARLYALPGSVEVDTFATATGIAGASNTANGATGNRVGRISQATATAEYLVNIAAGGRYVLTYRVLQNSTSDASFRIVDVTNNTVLDTVTVTTNRTAAMITLTGKTVTLPAGRSIWRFESLRMGGANYNVDWFAANPEGGTTNVTMNTHASIPTYDVRAVGKNVIFQIPTANHVSVKMYDIKGRMVATLSDGMRNPGVHSVNISKSGISQGVYVVRMRSGGYEKSVRVNYSNK